jgi:hypothetical protein
MFGEPFGDGVFGDIAINENVGISSPSDFIADILNRRGKPSIGGDTVWFLELNGATVISPTPFEPDPNTHRQEYYYNSIDNIMYKRARSSSQNHVWVKMR